MNRRKILLGTILIAIVAIGTAIYTIPRINQANAAPSSTLEPQSLADLIRMPGFNNNLTDITNPTQMMGFLNQMQSAGPAVNGILNDAHIKFPNVNTARLTENCQQTATVPAGQLPCTLSEAKMTDPAASFFDVFFLLDPIPFQNASSTTAPTIMIMYAPNPCTVTGCTNIPPPFNMLAMYWDGNLQTVSRQPGVDPFIIINAMPYWFVRFHWFNFIAGSTPQIIVWSYWWHDSHNHPNWYWGVYWWWRVYLVNYYPKTWFSVYWYWWNWVYWWNWNWWSTYFPYYCNYATANYCG